MKNEVIIIDENTCAIVIVYKGNKFYTYIDKEDLEKVSKFKTTWHLNVNRTGNIDGVRTRVQLNKNRTQIWLHNIILEKENETNIIDHIDHNTLNNKKSNLREVTKEENAQNISITLNSTTKNRNITKEDDKYRVRINGKSFGRYNSLEEAKEIAEIERKKIFPKSSSLNNKVFLDKT